MLDKEKVKSSEEVVENIEKEKEEEKVQEVNEEKASENETDKINEFVEEEKSPKNKEEINKSAEEETNTESNNNDLKNKVSFLQYFKEGIKNTLGIFVVSIGGLAIVGLVLRYILGLYVKDIWGMLFVVYLVVSLFYPYIKAKFYKKNK
ncbi:TPA: DNA-binding protein [Clostridium botulinum]|uniref:DNA-binding protein n=1 Tax=Clostridium botulinum TaxID=1491 RepID=UPI0004A598C0|nr:DNA-binding protein [Clostridium botulinum]KEI85673.1 DNA-binding protein [Clostridium botulinum B2 275]KEJ02954.1 DNA-binding protein [Clostridium botulinum A2B3 87]MBN3407968.1 DNA-binding protein [Clostridium botulinum]MBY6794900.1 DNA-binding protein [Clostridium botulinum]MBY6866164.1 DNA-binding protein [Clostridium botulinum]